MKLLTASNSSKLSLNLSAEPGDFFLDELNLQQEYVEDYNTATMPSKKSLWLQRLKSLHATLCCLNDWIFRPKNSASLEYCVLFANPPKLCLVWIGFPRLMPCTNICW